MELVEVGSGPAVSSTPGTLTKVQPFDRSDCPNRCRELLRRIANLPNSSASPPFKWDIIELIEESRDQLEDVKKANGGPDKGLWQEISDALSNESTASTLPVGLRKQCEEQLGRREMWLLDFETELRGILARGKEVRERLLFEDVDRTGWFSATGVSPLEVQRLLERHLDMHQRAGKLARQLKLLCNALQQQGAVSSRRRAFQARTVGEKLQSSLVCLAAVAVAPVPGSSEMWLATTTMMLLDKDQAWQHVVYEHPRDADTETILNQFQCRSMKARAALAAWLAMPLEKRRGCVLIHNASVRRVIVKPHLVSCIDGYDSGADWTAALEAHPLGSVMRRAFTTDMDESRIVIGAQRLAVVKLPPKPDTNWSWRGLFSYGDMKVGECALREAGVFSFICVDCGLRVGDREGACETLPPGEDDFGHETPQATKQVESSPQASPKDTNPFLVQVEHDAVLAKTVVKRSDGAVIDKGKIELEEEEEGKETVVEIVNNSDEPLQVKIFDPAQNSHASRLFRSALAEGVVSPGTSRLFPLKANKDGSETDFDVEVRIGNRKAKCEVVGDQVVFVDGFLAE